MHGSAKQILSDPTGHRSLLVTILCLVFGGVVILVAMVVTYGLFVAPELPAFAFVERKPIYFGGGEADFAVLPRQHVGRGGARTLLSGATRTKRLAYFADDEAGSLDALQKHATELDGVLVDWLGIDSPDGRLKSVGASETRTRAWLRGNAPATGTYPLLSSRLSGKEITQILANADSRERLISDIIGYVLAHDDRGIAIPVSIFPVTGKAMAGRFVSELFRDLRTHGRTTITVIDDPSDRPWLQELARISEFVLINCYAEVQDRREPDGPIASQSWVEDRVAAISSLVPPSKLIIGLGSFARDVSLSSSRLLSVPQAWEIMGEAGTRSRLDGASLNVRFRYFDGVGTAHELWLLDAVSVFNQLRGVLPHQPAGVALWRLGLEDPGAWSSLARGRLPDEQALAAIATVSPGTPVSTGTQEVVWAGSGEKHGRRELVFSPGQGLITQADLVEIPASTKITGFSRRDEKVVALTFDDGPHEVVTPKILDILRDKNIKATFFVVGRNALANPTVLARLRNEGHDIGNHSYSHADLFTLAQRELHWELNALQRILEAELGIHTTLFRPPFNGVAGSNMPGAVNVVAAASRLGYLTVLSGVDSGDWLNPPAGVIVDRVVGGVAAGRGQVVLFHDWGKRESTVAALPRIIDELAARGYRFIAVHELLGLKPAEVMPVIEPGSILAQTTADARSRALLTFGWLGRALPVIAVIAGALCIARIVFVILAMRKHKRLEASRENIHHWPKSVAVIIPAYNEEPVIAKTIRSVLLHYPDYEIIVVDDGSSDATAETALQAFGEDQRVRVFKKANGGKAAAANFALTKTSAEVVVCIDADTVVAPDAIPLLARHFEDPAVGAVAGTAVVGNPVNFLTRMQSLEYAIGQSLDRRAFALFNANGIVPGAIGAWRRRALVGVGGYQMDTVTEDADMTFSVIQAGWKVLYEPRAVARTEAPETWRAFLKQRYRWMYGMLQVVTKHGSETWRGTPLGLLTIPNVIVFQFGYSVLIPILDILSLLQIAQAGWQALHGDQASSVPTSGLVTYAKWWLLFQAADLLVMASALRLSGMPGAIRLVPLLLAQRFCYWPLIYWTALSTMLAAAKGRVTGWNKLKRSGRVPHDESVRIGM